MTIPPGFSHHFRSSPVTRPWEPLYSRTHDEGIDIGFVAAEAHCNGRGFLHGGVIAALADNAMGLSYVQCVSRSTNRGAAEPGAVTVNLTIDYVASANCGEWIEISPRIIRAGSRLGFVDAVVKAEGRLIARANAIFRLPGPNSENIDASRE